MKEMTKEEWEEWFCSTNREMTAEYFRQHFNTVKCTCHSECNHWMVEIKDPE